MQVVGAGEPLEVHVAVPLLGFTVYDVMGPPPVDAGAVQLTVAAALPGFATTAVGAPGRPMVTAAEAAELGPLPSAFVPNTVKV